MLGFSEKELMFLKLIKRLNFADRVESIGSMAPGDDEAELMEWRFLREDIQDFIKDAKCMGLVALREKYPSFCISSEGDEDDCEI